MNVIVNNIPFSITILEYYAMTYQRNVQTVGELFIVQ